MIHQLDPVTIGQIAAGEVVERPLSVVKELVENAIDAGATRVHVNVENGGLDLIEVIDDGTGIAPDELEIAVKRHATSKLSIADDLQSIGTLGFRGEGLASIAAVARVEVISRQPIAEIGARIRTHAEEAGEREPAAAPVGTRVRAEGLFENVPVRREYLRTASAEFGRISAWLEMFSLAYPSVTFVLRHDNKDVWTFPASPDVTQRLAMVFGKAATDALIPLGADAPGLNGTLSGFISSPGNDRGDRRMQILFVNGRLLRSTLLAGAWTAGYSTFAMIGRHPYGVLFLDVPPDHVDPNVHPTKSDVRLRYSTQIFDAVKRAISTTLRDRAAVRFENDVGGTGVSFAPSSIDASLEHVQSLFEHVHGDADEVPGHRMRVLGQIHHTYILATD
ncbi:MAG: DNA mismatch repair endonuclease MutL, partial [Candidatus Eremiobacteraeota bacterium]|nr:DNA mismatch repair endonuclease MutL [Candidatus Eremiobacteraeota bacterium]